MKQIICGTLWIPMLCQRLTYLPTPTAQSIVCADEDGLVAGVVYDHFNGAVVHAHIVVERQATKDWYRAIFDYPFNVLGVKKIVGQVSSYNLKALHLDKSLGFEEEGRIKEFFTSGADMVILTMRREQCKVLNDPLWTSGHKKAVNHNGRN
jgi:hypothetical protein